MRETEYLYKRRLGSRTCPRMSYRIGLDFRMGVHKKYCNHSEEQTDIMAGRPISPRSYKVRTRSKLSQPRHKLYDSYIEYY